MGKKKAGKRGGSGSVESPRARTGQEEPVTDTVLQVIARRIRNAKKKLSKVAVIEGYLEEGHKLNEDQERVYQSKAPLTAIIEELQKMEPLVAAALDNELEEHVQNAKLQWSKQTESEVAPQLASEEMGDNEAKADIQAKENTENFVEKREIDEGPSMDVPSEARLDENVDFEALDRAIEALYFLQLFVSARFDLTPLVGDASDDKEGVLTTEEAETLECFTKRIFQSCSHIPQDALKSAKEATKCLMLKSDAETQRVLEIISKLKNSEMFQRELKLTVHGFPISIEKEVSDTTTDKSEEKLKQEPSTTDGMPSQDIGNVSDDHPSPQTPIYPSPLYTPAEVLLQKGPRPFLPFPGMALSGPPPMGFAPPHPSTAVPVLPFYGVPLTGTYMRPTSQLHPQSNPMTFPPPAEEEIEMKKAEYSHDAEAETISEPSEENEASEETMKETLPFEETTQLPVSNERDLQSATKEAENVPAEGRQPSPRRQNGGGRFSNDRSQWYRGGRQSYPNRGGYRSRGGRGRGSNASHRPPYDPSQGPRRAPFMQASGGERHPYDYRGRRRGSNERQEPARHY